MRHFFYLFVASLALGLFFIVVSSNDTHAQTNSISLGKPYYGTEIITSHFDHRYPKYTLWPNTTYTNFIHYNGLDAPSCTPICYDGHSGIDFSMSYEEVLAAADGIVTTAEWDVQDCHGPPDAGSDCKYGLHINVAHENGYTTEYGHLSSIAVEVGDSIRKGQIIGTSGNTGNSGNPHLHFGVYLNDIEVDPFGWSGVGMDPWEQHPLGTASERLWDFTTWPGTPIPTPEYTGYGVMEDEDAAFFAGCDDGVGFDSCIYWHEEIGVGEFNDMWWTETIAASDVDYWALWLPQSLFPRFVDVDVYVPEDYATSWNVDFKVRGADNIWHHTIVDQYGIGTIGHWLSLGTYYFSSTGNTISVDSNTGELSGLGRKLGIDAIRFKRRKAWIVYLPTAAATSTALSVTP